MHSAIYIFQDKFEGAMTPNTLFYVYNQQTKTNQRNAFIARVHIFSSIQCVYAFFFFTAQYSYQTQMPNVNKGNTAKYKKQQNDTSKIRCLTHTLPHCLVRDFIEIDTRKGGRLSWT